MYNLLPIDNVNAASIKKRSQIITSNRLKRKLSSEADFIINPDTMGMEWSDFNAIEKILKKENCCSRVNFTIARKNYRKKERNTNVT